MRQKGRRKKGIFESRDCGTTYLGKCARACVHESFGLRRSFSLSSWLQSRYRTFSFTSGVPWIMNSPVSSSGPSAILILVPFRRRISVIFVPARPRMHPTMPDRVKMPWVWICAPLAVAALFVARREKREEGQRGDGGDEGYVRSDGREGGRSGRTQRRAFVERLWMDGLKSARETRRETSTIAAERMLSVVCTRYSLNNPEIAVLAEVSDISDILVAWRRIW